MLKIDTEDGLFHQSKPGDPTPSTRVPAWWLNNIQLEMINVITGLGGLKLDANDNTQLSQAIDKYFKFGEPVRIIDVPGVLITPVVTNVDLAKDGGYFYFFLGVCEQLTTPEATLIPFELIAFKQKTSQKWKCFLKPFDPAQKLPIVIAISDSGQLLLTSPDWPQGVTGKVHLALHKREKAS